MRQLILHPLEQLCVPVSQAAIGIFEASLPSLLVIL